MKVSLSALFVLLFSAVATAGDSGSRINSHDEPLTKTESCVLRAENLQRRSPDKLGHYTSDQVWDMCSGYDK